MNDKIPDNFKERKQWLKKKARESFEQNPLYSEDEPTYIGNPDNIFKEDDELFDEENTEKDKDDDK